MDRSGSDGSDGLVVRLFEWMCVAALDFQNIVPRAGLPTRMEIKTFYPEAWDADSSHASGSMRVMA